MINSCSSFKEEKAQGLKTIHVEVDNLRDDVKLSEFAEAKLVPLQIRMKYSSVENSTESRLQTNPSTSAMEMPFTVFHVRVNTLEK